MGVLDEAIREHLELKRRHGADPGEVARLEHEALGPARARGGPGRARRGRGRRRPRARRGDEAPAEPDAYLPSDEDEHVEALVEDEEPVYDEDLLGEEEEPPPAVTEADQPTVAFDVTQPEDPERAGDGRGRPRASTTSSRRPPSSCRRRPSTTGSGSSRSRPRTSTSEHRRPGAHLARRLHRHAARGQPAGRRPRRRRARRRDDAALRARDPPERDHVRPGARRGGGRLPQPHLHDGPASWPSPGILRWAPRSPWRTPAASARRATSSRRPPACSPSTSSWTAAPRAPPCSRSPPCSAPSSTPPHVFGAGRPRRGRRPPGAGAPGRGHRRPAAGGARRRRGGAGPRGGHATRAAGRAAGRARRRDPLPRPLGRRERARPRARPGSPSHSRSPRTRRRARPPARSWPTCTHAPAPRRSRSTRGWPWAAPVAWSARSRAIACASAGRRSSSPRGACTSDLRRTSRFDRSALTPPARAPTPWGQRPRVLQLGNGRTRPHTVCPVG